MQIESFSANGFGALKNFSADLTQYPTGAIVAVCGENGAGKSTSLELALPGALSRETPTRGTLPQLATTRDACLESRIRYRGALYAIKHCCDIVSGKSTAAVTVDGIPALDSEKASTFDSYAALHFPPMDVILSSVFRAQGSEGLVDAKPAERKAILLRALGIDRLEGLAKAARGKQAEASQEAAILRGKLEQLATLDSREELEAELASAQQQQDAAAHDLANARQSLEVAREIAKDSALARARYLERVAQLEALERKQSEISAALKKTRERMENNQELLGRKAEIEAAVAEAEALASEKTSAQQSNRESCSLLDMLTKRRTLLFNSGTELSRSIASATKSITTLKQQLDSLLGKIAKAEEQLPAATAEQLRAEADLSTALRELEALQGQRLSGAEDRIGYLRSGLEVIWGGVENPATEAYVALHHDNEVVAIADTLPAKLASAKDAAQRARIAHEATTSRLAELKVAIEQASSVQILKSGIDDAANRLAADSAGEAKLLEELAATETECAAASSEKEDCDRRIAKVNERHAALLQSLKLAAPLAQAKARIEELTGILSNQELELDSITAEISAFQPPTPPESSPELVSLEQCVAAAQEQANAASGALGRIGAQLEAMSKAEEQSKALRLSLAQAEAEVADWTHLAHDLGKDGLQASEVDAAGPELTAITNELLHECHGARWSIRFDSQVLKADGKGTKETLAITVIDCEKGREAPIETFSGGERVILGEAVSLALSVVGCRRLGLERPTLVRDESGAALDTSNAAVYVAMLRRAAGILQASLVLLVSHSPEVQSYCDASLVIGGAQ